MTDYSIEARELTKSYGKKTALDHISLQLHADQIIGLIGSNGSGKTTFFKICAGLEDYQDGKLQILGTDPWKDMATRSEMIFSPCDMQYRHRLKQMVQFYGIMYDHFDREFAIKLLEIFGFSLSANFMSLSKGMRNIFTFLMAISCRCRVTLLDEPFTGIDIEKRKRLYDILLRDYMAHPRTFVLSSHNLSEIDELLSEMIFLHEGKVVFYQDMDEVRNMLCKISGNETMIQKLQDSLAEGSLVKVVHQQTSSHLIVRCCMDSDIISRANAMDLTTSPVSPEDVCAYLMDSGLDEQIDQLWEDH